MIRELLVRRAFSEMVGISWRLFIDDISSRQMQELHVRVGNYENDPTQVELMAWDVVDVTKDPSLE